MPLLAPTLVLRGSHPSRSSRACATPLSHLLLSQQRLRNAHTPTQHHCCCLAAAVGAHSFPAAAAAAAAAAATSSSPRRCRPPLASLMNEDKRAARRAGCVRRVPVLATALLCLLTLSTSNLFTSSSSSSRHRPTRQHARTPAAAASTDIRLFVGVLSASHNREARQAIRATWGADTQLAGVAFFMLRPTDNATWAAVRREAAQHRDVVVTAGVVEHYYSITHAVLDMFKAAAGAGPAITHFMKTDDDCFVRVPLLLAALARMPRQRLYAGYPMAPGSVVRAPGWHQVPYANWASDAPVRYGFGLGYVLSMDLASHIAAGAAATIMAPDNLLIIEDIAIGFIVDAVARDLNETIHYDGSMRMSVAGGCSADDVVTHITQPPAGALHAAKWQVLRCMHAAGGRCCSQSRVGSL